MRASTNVYESDLRGFGPDNVGLARTRNGQVGFRRGQLAAIVANVDPQAALAARICGLNGTDRPDARRRPQTGMVASQNRPGGSAQA